MGQEMPLRVRRHGHNKRPPSSMVNSGRPLSGVWGVAAFVVSAGAQVVVEAPWAGLAIRVQVRAQQGEKAGAGDFIGAKALQVGVFHLTVDESDVPPDELACCGDECRL